MGIVQKSPGNTVALGKVERLIATSCSCHLPRWKAEMERGRAHQSTLASQMTLLQ